MARTKFSETAKGYGKDIAKIDRVWRCSSLCERVSARIRFLYEREHVRPTYYGLDWFVSTGRSCTEFEQALVDMKPTQFAQTALDIVAKHGAASIREIADAWKLAVAPQIYHKTNRYMFQVEVGGEWYRFIVDGATNGHHAAALALEFGVPINAHVSVFEARVDESYPSLTKADVERLASIGWTWHGQPLTT